MRKRLRLYAFRKITPSLVLLLLTVGTLSNNTDSFCQLILLGDAALQCAVVEILNGTQHC